jgi:hypothetical protein
MCSQVGRLLTEIGAAGAAHFNAPPPVQAVHIDSLLSDEPAPTGFTFGGEDSSEEEEEEDKLAEGSDRASTSTAPPLARNILEDTSFL